MNDIVERGHSDARERRSSAVHAAVRASAVVCPIDISMICPLVSLFIHMLQ